MSDYPELDRMSAVSDESQKIGEFLEWASEQGIRLMRFESGDFKEFCTGGMFDGCDGGFRVSMMNKTTNDPCKYCGGSQEVTRHVEGFQDAFSRTEEALASYFDIDLKKVDQERNATLRKLQEQNA